MSGSKAAESRFIRHADLLLAALVVSIVAMMIVPLPTPVLDVLITLNITFSVIFLMVGIYVTDALRVSAFPTILLLTTLFRLALNVSSTRLILVQADAGEVIRSFGEFVVQGNFVVGAVIFLILTLIQFIVIAKGGERVAEVAARFTLDAMPGKQMSIDADLRAGAISQDEARRRRTSLARESQLYGSMDGAMKFVKGDAIAGIVITIVNIVGGLIIGVSQRGMAAGDALRQYGLLTIGDGLVSQIPALVMSVAAALIVTRVAAEEEGTHLGKDIGRQLAAQPKAIAIGAGLLVLLALVPGLPKVPFLLLAVVFGAIALSLYRRQARPVAVASTAPGATPASDAPTLVSPLTLELAPDLVAAVGLGTPAPRLLVDTIPEVRRGLHAELGVIVPAIRVREAPALAPGGWRLRLAEVPVHEDVLRTDRRYVSEPPAELAGLGVTAEPAMLLGRAASWIDPADAARVREAGLGVYEPVAVLGRALAGTLARHAHELIGIQEAQTLLDLLDRSHPALVREVVPKIVSPVLLAEVLRRLVEEGVSIRDLRAIVQALGDWGRAEKDPVILTEYVRTALKRQLTHQFARGPLLPAYLVEPMVEDAIKGAITRTATGSFLALEPDLAREIQGSFRKAFAQRAAGAPPPVVLTTMELRRYVKKLVEVEDPHAVVLSFQELLPTVNLQPLGRIGAS
jgi:type III secretion protein V